MLVKSTRDTEIQTDRQTDGQTDGRTDRQGHMYTEQSDSDRKYY